MRVLVIGGSGNVAGLVLPALKQKHTLCVFDRKPPTDGTLKYVCGDACDFTAVADAAAGMDAVLYMAMGRFLKVGECYPDNVDALTSSLDANVKGLYLSLQAASHAGVSHCVYTGTMSIYAGDLESRYFADEDVTPDAADVYGFTKRLGEEVCRNVVRERAMSINVLRLCLPVPNDTWLRQARWEKPTIQTAADDVSRAILAALEYRGNGFQSFMISGDYEEKILNMSRAERILGWEPLARPCLP